MPNYGELVKGRVGTATTFVAALSSAGLALKNAAGQDCLLLGAGGGQSATFYDGVNVTGALDQASATTMQIGVNNATAITIAKAGVTTTVAGPLTASVSLATPIIQATTANLNLYTATADGSDTRNVGICGGGAATDTARGAWYIAYGNEATTYGGKHRWACGAVVTGATTGWLWEDSAGNNLCSLTAGGAWTFFSNSNANLDITLTPATTAGSYRRSITWGTSATDTSLPTVGTPSVGEKLTFYRSGTAFEAKVDSGDAANVALLANFAGGSSVAGNNIAWGLYTAVGGTTYSPIITATAAGAVTLGPSTGTSSVNNRHAVRAAYGDVLRLDNVATGGAVQCSMTFDVNGGNKWQIGTDNNYGTGGFFWFPNGGTYVGGITSAGVWTLGQSPSASNASQLAVGSTGACTIFRNSAADGNVALTLSRAGTNNGSEVYIAFADGGTSASSPGTDRFVARVNSGNSNIEFVSTSDARLKNVVGSYSNGLEIVKNTPVRQWSWKTSPEKVTYGFIAQELQATMPECVYEMESGFLGVGLSQTTFVMWNAIQELHAELQATKAELSALKAA